MLLNLARTVDVRPRRGFLLYRPEVVPAVERHHLVGLEVDEFGDQEREFLARALTNDRRIHDLGVGEPPFELDRERLGVRLQTGAEGRRATHKDHPVTMLLPRVQLSPAEPEMVDPEELRALVRQVHAANQRVQHQLQQAALAPDRVAREGMD